MSDTSSPFVIEEHTFEGQHIREYPAALANSQEDILKLHCKSYTPRDVASGKEKGQLTIIAFHANAFNKEVYEPFFEDLYMSLKEQHGLTIGSIWIADQANQGHSAVLNDGVLGNDPAWFDHSRDVLQMVNTFRKQMKRPIIAVGHSLGGTQAVAAANFHPRLFESVVLVDPSITMLGAKSGPQMMKFTMSKPETFKSREEAEAFVMKHPFFGGWDPRARRRYIDTAFHEGPTLLHPQAGLVRPKTHAHQEVLYLARPNLEHVAVEKPVTEKQRYTHPDVWTAAPSAGPMYNPHPRAGYSFLATLRPSALFIQAKNSQICPPEELEHRLNFTGSRPGGSGGVKAGNVSSVEIKGGHFVPMTNPKGLADTTANWISKRLQIWREAEDAFAERWNSRSPAQKQRLEPEFEKIVKTWEGKYWKNSTLR